MTDCIHSRQCSIAVHPNFDRYHHVALINLSELNRSKSLSTPFLAQYLPKEDNLCHFEIIPQDGTVLKKMEFAAFLDAPFPETNMPRTESDIQQAEEAYEFYSQIIDIEHWTRPKPN